MTNMNEVTELEMQDVDGGNPIVMWFLGNLAYAIIDSLAGSPGCSGAGSCYDAGYAAAQ